MGLQKGFAWPILVAAWASIVFLAIWEIQTRPGDSALAFTAGSLLLTSLAISRYALGLTLTSSPILYLALLGLFHLGLVVPWELGVYDASRISSFSPHGLSKGLGLIIYSIVSFESGLIAALGVSGYRQDSLEKDENELANRNVFAMGLLLLVAAIILFITGLIRLDPVGYYRITYSEIFRLRAETDPRFFGSSITIGFIGLCLAVSGASKAQFLVAFWCTALWTSVLFYFGFRGPALIALVIVYAMALKKRIGFPKWLPWLATALLLIVVPIQAALREEPLNQRSFPALDRLNLLDGPAEMGASIEPLVETADIVGAGSYRHGRTYLKGIEAILPNLALRWESPVTESLEDLPPSLWITAIVDPWTYKNYGGMGFSAVAEPYMNFGTAGVVIFFFGLAFCLVWLERVSIRNPYALASWALVVGSLLWTTRNDSSGFFRPAAWGLLCLAGLRLWPGGRVRKFVKTELSRGSVH
jgi:O-antigen polysaccharide polymerase Wzy